MYRCYYQMHHSLFLPISLYDFLCIWKSDSRSSRCDPKLRASYTQAAPDCRLCTYVGLTATHTWQMSARAHKHVIVVSSSIEYICTHRNRCSTFNWRVIRSRVTNMKLGYGVSYMYALSYLIAGLTFTPALFTRTKTTLNDQPSRLLSFNDDSTTDDQHATTIIR
jgi:hypothetical protein